MRDRIQGQTPKILGRRIPQSISHPAMHIFMDDSGKDKDDYLEDYYFSGHSGRCIIRKNASSSIFNLKTILNDLIFNLLTFILNDTKKIEKLFEN